VAPVFLRFDEVIRIHRDQLERYGGSPGIRDINLLKSAVAVPTASFGGEFLHRDIYEMASAYLFHIVQNHPFVDGNKRTGAVAAVVFLLLNGIELNASEKKFEILVLGTAQGKNDKAKITEFFRTHSG